MTIVLSGARPKVTGAPERMSEVPASGPTVTRIDPGFARGGAGEGAGRCAGRLGADDSDPARWCAMREDRRVERDPIPRPVMPERGRPAPPETAGEVTRPVGRPVRIFPSGDRGGVA